MSARFCYTCGHKLKVTKYTAYYVEETGQAVIFEAYDCPRTRWYERFFESHPVTSSDAYVYFG